MRPIRPLDYHLINKIAAGEVVERPLSVVKELTENAIDAGASIITVEIRDGGLTQIRVTDNGRGIPADQLPLAFARHATSKIESVEDLFEIMTLGFRGEALSSIAAVAQVEMITKTPGSVAGTRIEIHGGQEMSRQEIGCADGTTVIVSNLFYNTPARRKFLKKPATETGYISDMMQKLALCNPRLTFRYINNGQLILQTNGNSDLKTALYYVYGREISSKLIAVQAELDGITLDGYIGKPETARGNRQFGHFFINGRYVKSQLLQQAVEAGMKTMLPAGKFPLYALHVGIQPGAVDVNVHPAKMEVRFSDEEGISLFVQQAINTALSEHDLIPEVALSHKTPKTDTLLPYEEQSLTPVSAAAPVRHAFSDENEWSLREERAPHKPARLPWDTGTVAMDWPTITVQPLEENDRPFPNSKADKPPPLPAEDPLTAETPTIPFFNDYTLLGLLFKTYWLVAQGDSLYLIDQHAAHERVLFEEFTAQAESGSIHAQPLLEPVILRLTPREVQILRDHASLFERFGFDITDRTDTCIAIRSVPFMLRGPLPTGFFTEVLDKLEGAGNSNSTPYAFKVNALAMAACKAAVKANDVLSETEARTLILKMLALKNPFTCPHGRPTIIEITRHELERKFKRVT